jgi:hypothetical protein
LNQESIMKFWESMIPVAACVYVFWWNRKYIWEDSQSTSEKGVQTKPLIPSLDLNSVQNWETFSVGTQTENDK